MKRREHNTEGFCWCHPAVLPNEDASGFVFVHRRIEFVPPFQRLRFRLRNGFWCEHTRWGEWEMIDMGMRKMRHCEGCGYAEIV
jgi:hypothetical protein